MPNGSLLPHLFLLFSLFPLLPCPLLLFPPLITHTHRLEGKVKKAPTKYIPKTIKKNDKQTWGSMRQAELRVLLKKHELKVHGNKIDLIKRLQEAQVDIPAPPPHPHVYT